MVSKIRSIFAETKQRIQQVRGTEAVKSQIHGRDTAKKRE